MEALYFHRSGRRAAHFAVRDRTFPLGDAERGALVALNDPVSSIKFRSFRGKSASIQRTLSLSLSLSLAEG